MSNRIPRFNATGKWELRAPYSCSLTKSYRCAAIENFPALEHEKIDIHSRFYAGKGLPVSVFNADRSASVVIVTMIAEDGEVIYVPSSYIIKFPNSLSVPHLYTVLSVDMGLMPTDMDYHSLVTEVNNLVQEMVGVTTETHVNVIPGENFISEEEANTMKNARHQAQNAAPSLRARAGELNDKLEGAKLKIKQLQNSLL